MSMEMILTVRRLLPLPYRARKNSQYSDNHVSRPVEPEILGFDVSRQLASIGMPVDMSLHRFGPLSKNALDLHRRLARYL